MLVTTEDVISRLPSTISSLPPEETKRLGMLIEDAEALIREAFMRAGRDFDTELETVPWLKAAAQRVIREMVSAAVIVGSDVGKRSVSSTTGQESDSITYSDVSSVSFGGVRLTDLLCGWLGLDGNLPRGKFPTPLRWPEKIRGRHWRQ